MLVQRTYSNVAPYLKSWELYRDKPYYATPNERAQKEQTLGWGTLFLNNSAPASCTPDQANQWVTDKINKASNFLTKYKFQTNEQRDAVIAAMYNLGLNGFPKMLQCIGKGDFDGAYLQFFDGVYQTDPDTGVSIPLENLFYRRACDAQIFKSGIYLRREFITLEEKSIFLHANKDSQLAINMINNALTINN